MGNIVTGTGASIQEAFENWKLNTELQPPMNLIDRTWEYNRWQFETCNSDINDFVKEHASDKPCYVEQIFFDRKTPPIKFTNVVNTGVRVSSKAYVFKDDLTGVEIARLSSYTTDEGKIHYPTEVEAKLYAKKLMSPNEGQMGFSGKLRAEIIKEVSDPISFYYEYEPGPKDKKVFTVYSNC